MIPKINLTTDYTISRIIKGGWQLAGGHGKIDRKQAILDMVSFAEAGITTFDCADIYTGVEDLIGQFKVYYNSNFGSEKAKTIKVHTKFVPDLRVLSSISKSDVELAIDRSLLGLRTEQLELVQLHWWDYEIPHYVEVVGYLKELQQKGKISHIGVTNFDVPCLGEIIESGVKIVSNQVQYSILDNRPEHGMTEFCKLHDIKLLCYGTVAGGFLSDQYFKASEPEEPLENRSLTKYKLNIEECGTWGTFQNILETLHSIALRKQVSISALATRYILEKSRVSGIIVGARNAKHLEDLSKVLEFILDESDMRRLDLLQRKLLSLRGGIYGLEREKNGRHAGIMKYDINSKRQV